MPIAFSETNADFPALPQYGFTYQRCRSQAFVAVDEEGTEAAAATGVVIGLAAMPQYSMTVDQPFIFLIRDLQTTHIICRTGAESGAINLRRIAE